MVAGAFVVEAFLGLLGAELPVVVVGAEIVPILIRKYMTSSTMATTKVKAPTSLHTDPDVMEASI